MRLFPCLFGNNGFVKGCKLEKGSAYGRCICAWLPRIRALAFMRNQSSHQYHSMALTRLRSGRVARVVLVDRWSIELSVKPSSCRMVENNVQVSRGGLVAGSSCGPIDERENGCAGKKDSGLESLHQRGVGGTTLVRACGCLAQRWGRTWAL